MPRTDGKKGWGCSKNGPVLRMLIYLKPSEESKSQSFACGLFSVPAGVAFRSWKKYKGKVQAGRPQGKRKWNWARERKGLSICQSFLWLRKRKRDLLEGVGVCGRGINWFCELTKTLSREPSNPVCSWFLFAILWSFFSWIQGEPLYFH